MKTPEYQELEELALLAELARPLVHECNNFLNNLLLQMVLSENDFPEPVRADWQRIHQDGRGLARLLHEWQRQRRPSDERKGKTELNAVIQEVVEEFNANDVAPRLQVRLEPQALLVLGAEVEWRRLFCLVFRHAVHAWKSEQASGTLEIQTERTNNRAIIRVSAGKLEWADFADTAQARPDILFLMAAACKSLVERLSGSIRIEKSADGASGLVMELKLA
jgi:hypothetical protein